MYINEENINNIVNYKHTPTPFNQTHRIVTFNYKKDIDRGPGYWKMNTSIMNDRLFNEVVEKTFDDVQDLNIMDPIEKWQIFIETIRLEAQVYSKKKRYHEKKLKFMYEKNIEILEENNPNLSTSSKLLNDYEYNLKN